MGEVEHSFPGTSSLLLAWANQASGAKASPQAKVESLAVGIQANKGQGYGRSTESIS